MTERSKKIALALAIISALFLFQTVPHVLAIDNTVPVADSGFQSGVNDPCKGKTDCYSPFSGFADALGTKFTTLSEVDSLGSFINAIIALGIGLGGILAVVMIMYQGFLYMKTDNVNTKTETKNKIINTVIGFVLLLSIFTILKTINPDLLNLTPGIDASTLASIPDRSADPQFQQTTTDLGVPPTNGTADPTDYNDPTFLAYLYHQQGAGGAPTILWAAKKGYSSIPTSTPFIKGDSTQINRNMANNVNKTDMQKIIGTSDITPSNFLKYWGLKVAAARDSTKPIDATIDQAVSQAALDSNTDSTTMKAICRLESACSPTIAAKCNAYGYCGLFQLSSAVFAQFSSGGTIYDPYSNAFAGGKYSQYNVKMYTSQKSSINN